MQGRFALWFLRGFGVFGGLKRHLLLRVRLVVAVEQSADGAEDRTFLLAAAADTRHRRNDAVRQAAERQ